MDSQEAKWWLLEWAERRADLYRRDAAEASGLSSMLATWLLASIPFLIGIYIATPSALDQSWRTVIGLSLFLLVFWSFSRLDKWISKPAAALARWSSERYDALIELYLLDQVPEKEFRECAKSINASHMAWLEKDRLTRFREMNRQQKARSTPRILFFRLMDPVQQMKFARGEVGGPWDYLD